MASKPFVLPLAELLRLRFYAISARGRLDPARSSMARSAGSARIRSFGQSLLDYRAKRAACEKHLSDLLGSRIFQRTLVLLFRSCAHSAFLRALSGNHRHLAFKRNGNQHCAGRNHDFRLSCDFPCFGTILPPNFSRSHDSDFVRLLCRRKHNRNDCPA